MAAVTDEGWSEKLISNQKDSSIAAVFDGQSIQFEGVLTPRWRNALTIKNSLVASTSLVATQSSAFHSTAIAFEKWKKKWDSNFDSAEQPTKTYIKYATRQKRADTKKALKDLLYMSGSPRMSFQDEEDPLWKFDNKEADRLPSPGGWKDKPKSSARKAPKRHYKKMKRKMKRDKLDDNLDSNPETTFYAAFGDRFYTWSDINTAAGYEWRQHVNQEKYGARFKWRHAQRVNSWAEDRRSSNWTFGDAQSNREEISSSIGSSSDRIILGLPPRGPLELEDVKTAFRLSALKWHPDKHQGPSQSAAEEKFKLCSNAYKSLCGALSSMKL